MGLRSILNPVNPGALKLDAMQAVCQQHEQWNAAQPGDFGDTASWG